MLLKNVSYIVVEAINGTNEITRFAPGEEKEVSQADGEWFMNRYNEKETIFAVVGDESKVAAKKPAKAKVATPVEEEIVDEEESDDEELVEDGTDSEGFPCEVCGKVCASEFGLKAHMRAHK